MTSEASAQNYIVKLKCLPLVDVHKSKQGFLGMCCMNPSAGHSIVGTFSCWGRNMAAVLFSSATAWPRAALCSV